jgi:hypothetical protein
MQTVLHLTDLHFEWEGDDAAGRANRATCLEGMLDQLSKIEEAWRPEVVCLTGDLGWCGTASNYVEAKEWLDKLLGTCRLTYIDFVATVGNHDLFRPKAPERSVDRNERMMRMKSSHLQLLITLKGRKEYSSVTWFDEFDFKLGLPSRRRRSGRGRTRPSVAAVDDTKLAGVSVMVQTAVGALIEQGPAALDTKGGKWIYMTQAAVPESELAVAIEVTAVDRRVTECKSRWTGSSGAPEWLEEVSGTKMFPIWQHLQSLSWQTFINIRCHVSTGCYNICHNL